MADDTCWTDQAAAIAAAYLGNPANPVPADDVDDVVVRIYVAVERRHLLVSDPAPIPGPTPAVPVEESVGPDFIICLEDGVKLKMLKRYLRSQHNMTPEEYRAKWGLPADYPMVAPDYSERRSELAKSQGLGRKPVYATPRPRRAAGKA